MIRHLFACGTSHSKVQAGSMMMLVKERLAIGGVAVLMVLLAFTFCCPLVSAVPTHGCCKKQCAAASMPAPTAVMAAKPSLVRPLAIIATFSSTSDVRDFHALPFDAWETTKPHRFDPLISIQLRI